MIDAIKKIFNVRFPKETPWIRFQKTLGPFDGPKEAFVFPAGPGVVDEFFIIDFDEIIIDEPMDHPVTDTGNGNFPPLVVIHHKFFIPAMVIRPILKIMEKIEKIFLQRILEFMKFRSFPFPFPESKPAVPNIF